MWTPDKQWLPPSKTPRVPWKLTDADKLFLRLQRIAPDPEPDPEDGA